MNERIGIIVPTNRQLYGFTKGRDERGVTVEKAVPRADDSDCNFGNNIPKIATYFSAKGLTFDSVLLPRLTEPSFSWVDEKIRLRLLFVGIARATQWIYLITVEGNEFAEMEIINRANSNGHLVLQYGHDSPKYIESESQSDDKEDEFSIL